MRGNRPPITREAGPTANSGKKKRESRMLSRRIFAKPPPRQGCAIFVWTRIAPLAPFEP